MTKAIVPFLAFLFLTGTAQANPSKNVRLFYLSGFEKALHVGGDIKAGTHYTIGPEISFDVANHGLAGFGSVLTDYTVREQLYGVTLYRYFDEAFYGPYLDASLYYKHAAVNDQYTGLTHEGDFLNLSLGGGFRFTSSFGLNFGFGGALAYQSGEALQVTYSDGTRTNSVYRPKIVARFRLDVGYAF